MKWLFFFMSMFKIKKSAKTADYYAIKSSVWHYYILGKKKYDALLK